jgi:hypothetical protein
MASAKDQKSTFFERPKFQTEFAKAVAKLLHQSDDDLLEVAASIIKGVRIPYDIDCDFHDDAEVDSVTKDVTVRCDLDVAGRTIDTWTRCVRVRWSDSSFSSVDITDSPEPRCMADEISKAYSTDSFMEMLDLEEPEEHDFSNEWWAQPPDPPEQDSSGDVAVVYDHQTLVATYADEVDAGTAIDMMEEADRYHGGYSIYVRMDNPEEDEEHGEYDELYGWEEAM